MAMSGDVTADAFARAISTMFNLGQAGIDWASVARALVSFREEEHQRWLDAHPELWEGASQAGRSDEPVHGDDAAGGAAAAMYVQLNAGLLASLLRAGRDWQHLLQENAPKLKRAVDEYAADLDPSPRVTEALVDAVKTFGQAVGEFVREQGDQFEHELLVLQDKILHWERDGASGRRVGRQKA